MHWVRPLNVTTAFSIAALISACGVSMAQSTVSPPDNVSKAILAPDARLMPIGFTVFEGPAMNTIGDVFFSDLAGNRMYRMSPLGQVSVFRENSGRANGNAFDHQGRLLTAEGAEIGPGGGRRIVRTDLTTGKVSIVADRYEGKRFNSPNDLALDSKGRLWFTDAYYGRDRSMLELPDEAVYRIDPVNGDLAGGVLRVSSAAHKCKGLTEWR